MISILNKEGEIIALLTLSEFIRYEMVKTLNGLQPAKGYK
jgi:hypothetical protein